MPIDHISLFIPSDVHKKTVEFYLAALKPLNYEKMMAFGPNEEHVGLGVKPHSDFWLTSTDLPVPKTHIAFTASGMS